MAAKRATLTPREHEVVAGYVQGETAAQLAARLGIGQKSIRTLLHRARGRYAAIGVETSTKIALAQAFAKHTAKPAA